MAFDPVELRERSIGRSLFHRLDDSFCRRPGPFWIHRVRTKELDLLAFPFLRADAFALRAWGCLSMRGEDSRNERRRQDPSDCARDRSEHDVGWTAHGQMELS